MAGKTRSFMSTRRRSAEPDARWESVRTFIRLPPSLDVPGENWCKADFVPPPRLHDGGNGNGRGGWRARIAAVR